jgi:hypothetical protein
MSRNSNDYVRISFTTKVRGVERVPNRSGLNWGQRPKRNPNQAYLPISVEIQKSNFFPDVGIPFTIECDDGQIFNCLRAQQNGKAIETPEDNSLMGAYFRQRLGVNPGDQVAMWHLIDYGRTSVEIFSTGINQYYLDFSRPAGLKLS